MPTVYATQSAVCLYDSPRKHICSSEIKMILKNNPGILSVAHPKLLPGILLPSQPRVMHTRSVL